MDEEEKEKVVGEYTMESYVVIPQWLFPLVDEVGWLSLKDLRKEKFNGDQIPTDAQQGQ